MDKKNSFASDIVMGERYVDKQTGYEGVATSVTFFQHACERVCIESYDSERRRVVEVIFDAPRLTHVETGVQAKTKRSGGPGMPNARSNPAAH